MLSFDGDECFVAALGDALLGLLDGKMLGDDPGVIHEGHPGLFELGGTGKLGQLVVTVLQHDSHSPFSAQKVEVLATE